MLGVPYFSKPPTSPRQKQSTSSVVIPFRQAPEPRPPSNTVLHNSDSLRPIAANIHSTAMRSLRFQDLKGLYARRHDHNASNSSAHLSPQCTRPKRGITPNLFHSQSSNVTKLLDERKQMSFTIQELDQLVLHLTAERDSLATELLNFHTLLHQFREYFDSNDQILSAFNNFFPNAHPLKKSMKRKKTVSPSKQKSKSPDAASQARRKKPALKQPSPSKRRTPNSRVSPAKSSPTAQTSLSNTNNRKPRKRSSIASKNTTSDKKTAPPVAGSPSPAPSSSPPPLLPVRPHSALQKSRQSPSVNRKKPTTQTPNPLNFTYDSTVEYDLIVAAAFKNNFHHGFESPVALQKRPESAAAFTSNRRLSSMLSPPPSGTPSLSRFNRRHEKQPRDPFSARTGLANKSNHHLDNTSHGATATNGLLSEQNNNSHSVEHTKEVNTTNVGLIESLHMNGGDSPQGLTSGDQQAPLEVQQRTGVVNDVSPLRSKPHGDKHADAPPLYDRPMPRKLSAVEISLSNPVSPERDAFGSGDEEDTEANGGRAQWARRSNDVSNGGMADIKRELRKLRHVQNETLMELLSSKRELWRHHKQQMMLISDASHKKSVQREFLSKKRRMQNEIEAYARQQDVHLKEVATMFAQRNDISLDEALGICELDL